MLNDQRLSRWLLPPDQVRELEHLTADIVHQRLPYAGAGAGSIVPALGDGKMLRGDVGSGTAPKNCNGIRFVGEGRRMDRGPRDCRWSGRIERASGLPKGGAGHCREGRGRAARLSSVAHSAADGENY
jgi:hypothetical protein